MIENVKTFEIAKITVDDGDVKFFFKYLPNMPFTAREWGPDSPIGQWLRQIESKILIDWGQ